MNEVVDLSNELEARADKIARLEKAGEKAYKAKFERSHRIHELDALELGTKVSTAGRVVLRRSFGKLIFAQIYDIDGTRQISLSLADVGDAAFNKFMDFVDIGDFVGVSGELYRTKTAELTIKVKEWTLLSKALRSLPEKFHGLSDVEARYRQRYLDFIANKQSREYIKMRFKVLQFLRAFYVEHGFIEVETPVLQNAVSGALAKPFITHHNALDMSMNLRISPEIPLKVCMGAGFDRVFEVAKDFRNEGLCTDKLQEFTMIESYAAYWDFEDSIKFYTKLFQETVKFVFGKYEFEMGGIEIDVSRDFKRLNYVEELNKIAGFNVLEITDAKEFEKKMLAGGLFHKSELEEVKTIGGMIDLLYKRIMRPKIIQPTILFNYPNIVPLARFNDKDNRIVDMFQLVVNGRELVKGYSELVDPIAQKANFEAQLEAKKKGDGEAMDFDRSYLLAMEHGFPPCSGIGFGVDVFLQNILGIENIRDTILFPITRPEGK